MTSVIGTPLHHQAALMSSTLMFLRPLVVNTLGQRGLTAKENPSVETFVRSPQHTNPSNFPFNIYFVNIGCFIHIFQQYDTTATVSIRWKLVPEMAKSSCSPGRMPPTRCQWCNFPRPGPRCPWRPVRWRWHNLGSTEAIEMNMATWKGYHH